MKHVYIFSGLGADERVFKCLDFSGCNTTFIKWTLPQSNESVENYAKRLTAQIVTSEPILIGLSFGGIIAVEVAKLVDTKKVILIASAKTRREIPFYYRLAGKLKIHRLLSTKLMKSSNAISNWLFGTENLEDRKLLADVLHDTDGRFLKWAIEKLVSWTNETSLKNLTHIHGTADRILPIRFVECDLIIKGGGHFMTINKSEEISMKLQSLL